MKAIVDHNYNVIKLIVYYLLVCNLNKSNKKYQIFIQNLIII